MTIIEDHICMRKQNMLCPFSDKYLNRFVVKFSHTAVMSWFVESL